METRTPNLARFLPFIALILASIVLAIIAFRIFGGSVPLEAQGYRVTLTLPQASSLNPQADVRVAGVKVGRVISVKLADRRARVVIEVQHRYAPLRADARPLLRTKTLLGEAYLELTPGSPRVPALADGGHIAADQTRPTQRLDDVLQTFAPRTRARMRSVITGLSSAFGGREADVNASAARLAPVTADLGDVADQIDRQRTSLGTLIADSGTVFATLGRRQGELRAAITAGNQVLARTAAHRRDLDATVRALPPFLASLKDSFGRLGDASGDLTRAVTTLRPVVPALGPALRAVTTAAPTYQRLFEALPPVITAGNRGLPAATRILAAAPPALQQTYPTVREFTPTLDLLGLVHDSLILTLANVGQIHGGYAVGPGNTVTNYVPGVITLWNETVAGWTKRLPTNRGNPYPAPDFLTDIGHFKSFDCRHIHNHLYLPALGAAPPCVQQQPWTYKGVTAYFPRLQPSPP